MAEWVPPGAVEVVPGGVSPTGTPGSGPQRKISFDSGPGLSQAETNRAMGNTLAHQVLPATAGFVAPMLIPGGGLASALVRLLASGAASGGTEAGVQAASGEPLDTRRIGEAAGMSLLGQGAGEVTAPLTRMLGTGMALDAVGATKVQRQMTPGIDRVIMRERIPAANPRAMGRPETVSGQEVIDARIGELGDQMRNLVARDVQTARPFSTRELLRDVDREISSLRRSADPVDAAQAASLRQMRDAYVKRNPNGIDADKLNRAVRSAQQRAKPSYTKTANGVVVAVQTTPEEQVFYRLVSRRGRSMLRQGIPEMIPLKNRTADLTRMRDVYNRVESTPPPKLHGFGDVFRMPSVVLNRTLLRPDVASRSGFLLSDPRTEAALRSTPNGIFTLLKMLGSQSAQPDALNPGGTR